MELLVADAVLHHDEKKIMTYWKFKIMCRCELPSYQKPPLFPLIQSDAQPNYVNNGKNHDFCVWRRYSDFDWFVEELREAFPGALIPPIPEKEMGGSVEKMKTLVSSKLSAQEQKDSQITCKRTRRLQLYLKYLAEQATFAHDHDLFKVFFTTGDPEFERHKQVLKKSKPEISDSIFSKGISIFNKVAEKKAEIFTSDSRMGMLRIQYDELATNLLSMSKQVQKVIDDGLKEIEMECPQEKKEDETPKPIDLITYHNDHFVVKGDQKGTIRHIEGRTVWVDFKGSIERVDYEELRRPSDDRADPAIIAFEELNQAIHSFISYCSVNKNRQNTEALVDMCWFWGRFCKSVGETITEIEAVEQDHHYAVAGAGKKKDEKKKAPLMEKATALHSKFVSACRQFESDYEKHFKPVFDSYLKTIISQYGECTSQFLADNLWPSRIQPADNVLKLNFDVPESIQQDIQRVKRSEPQGKPIITKNKDAAIPPAAPKSEPIQEIIPESKSSEPPTPSLETNPEPQPEAAATPEPVKQVDPFADE
eukprot:Tbor_TRINITY_DN5471_c3_g1::TRINITY_DN5471_c3_g1_i1::g.24201::m.24201